MTVVMWHPVRRTLRRSWRVRAAGAAADAANGAPGVTVPRDRSLDARRWTSATAAAAPSRLPTWPLERRRRGPGSVPSPPSAADRVGVVTTESNGWIVDRSRDGEATPSAAPRTLPAVVLLLVETQAG